jgi:peptidoglycan-associated lipoprotein
MKKSAILATLFPIFLTACAKSPQSGSMTPAETGSTNLNASQPAGDTPATTATTSPDAPQSSNLNAQETTGQSIYFDKEQFTVSAQYQPLLLQQAEHIKTGQQKVTLEGNADERGSSEFNLALGDRRAHAVKQSLQILGVPEAQLKAISYGEEKPRLTCHEEKCWRENRRVDVRDGNT